MTEPSSFLQKTKRPAENGEAAEEEQPAKKKKKQKEQDAAAASAEVDTTAELKPKVSTPQLKAI